MMDDKRDDADAWVARVKREVAPPAGARARIAGDLRQRGMLPARRLAAAQPWIRAAAAVVFFASGWLAASAYNAPRPPTEPRYMFLLFGETSAPPDLAARVDEYRAWAVNVREAGTDVSGERLANDRVAVGTQMREDDASLGGYFIVSAPSPDVARALAEQHPHTRHGGTIVIRPIAGG